MRRYLKRAALSAFIIFLLSGAVLGQQLADVVDYFPDVVIVKFNHEELPISQTYEAGIALSGITEFDDLNRQYHIIEMEPLFPKAIENDAPELAGYYRMIFLSDSSLESVIRAYGDLQSLETAESVPIHRIDFYPNDYYRSSQWALGNIDAYQAWDLHQGDPSVSIAILDTGVDWDHPDLNNDIWLNLDDPIGGGDTDGNGYVDDYRGWDFVTGVSNCWPGEDCSGQDNNPMDFAGHGTHVAGIAAAETDNGIGVAGIGFDCVIMCLRIGWLANNGWGYVSMDFAAQALYYAGNKGAAAANCSWGSSYTSYLANAVNYAHNHGVVIATSAGNSGNTDASYLSSRSDILSVAATNQSDNKASFSNYGSWVEVAAPGVSILSTYFNNTYGYLDGTSMASPYVAGLAGLISAADPSLTRVEIFNLIIDSADPIDDYYYNQGWLGGGRINAYNAVMDLGGVDPPAPTAPPDDSFTENSYPTFTWTEIPDATVYHIQVDDGDMFITPILDDETISENSYLSPISLPDDLYNWRVRAGNGLEWSDWSEVWSFGVDTMPPDAPTDLAVDPDGWTNEPTYSFSWTDPPDISGISLRFFKTDSPPENDYDYEGTFDESPENYSPTEFGLHTLYLWCMDNLEHVDYQNYASVDFFYDGTPPYDCIASSPPYTSSESFDVTWTIGYDDDSGVSGVYDVQYKEDDGPWTDWLVETTDLSAIFTGTIGYTYYFEARTYDNAGNYEPFTGIPESSTYITEGGALCGYYVVGDYNGNLTFNVADVISGFSKLTAGSPEPALSCECPAGSGNFWAVAMDVNNSCAFNVADIITAFSKLKTGSPQLIACEICPPDSPPIPPGNEIPLIKPKTDSEIGSR